jgi:uncharacterized flavoprotein (TIGR03862 family)
MQRAVVIGGGPSGLMAAETLLQNGISVNLYEAKPSIGRKFLMAGKSGLNITHAENLDTFLDKYHSDRVFLEPYVNKFNPLSIREWVEGLGIDTFEGSSHRIFPKVMKASPLLRNWLRRLNHSGLKIHLNHKWLGFNDFTNLKFSSPSGITEVNYDAVILGLGGASWPKLGSNAHWVNILTQKNIPIISFRPSNCGFNIRWSEHFKSQFAGKPVKSCMLTAAGTTISGDFNVTEYGLEGGPIYSHSRVLREQIENNGQASLSIDLAPNKTRRELQEGLSRPRGKNSLANHLRKTVKITGVKAGLLREFGSLDIFKSTDLLVNLIKSMPITLATSQSIERAISSAGGIPFEALDENLMIKAMPGFFASGEMLNWDAPTGGYLLTACLALGKGAADGSVKWLKQKIN